MTVVNPKSISGINSITMASGSDNLLTIHTTNTTERVRVNSDGDVIVGSGITVSPDGDIFATGVTTTGSLVSSGAISGTTGTFSGAVSGTTGTFTGDVDIASSLVHTGDTDTKLQFTTDNIALITGGTARVNITSGGNLEMPNDNDYIKIGAGQDLQLVHTGTASYIDNNSGDFYIRGVDEKWLYIQAKAGENSIICKDDAAVELYHDGSKQCETSANGLAFPSGKGIDFSATGDGSGSGTPSELLDDYEEGEWSPQIYYQNSGDQGDSNNLASYGWYQKVGVVVHISFFLRWTLTGSAANDNIGVKNFPFAQAPVTSTYGDAGGIGSVSHSGTSLNSTDCIVLKSTGSGSTMMLLEDIGSQGNMGDEFGANSGMRVWGSVTYRTT